MDLVEETYVEEFRTSYIKLSTCCDGLSNFEEGLLNVMLFAACMLEMGFATFGKESILL